MKSFNYQIVEYRYDMSTKHYITSEIFTGMNASSIVTRPSLALIFVSLFQAAMLAVRRSVWEAANADFAAAVLFEALQRTAVTTEASKL